MRFSLVLPAVSLLAVVFSEPVPYYAKQQLSGSLPPTYNPAPTYGGPTNTTVQGSPVTASPNGTLSSTFFVTATTVSLPLSYNTSAASISGFPTTTISNSTFFTTIESTRFITVTAASSSGLVTGSPGWNSSVSALPSYTPLGNSTSTSQFGTGSATRTPLAYPTTSYRLSGPSAYGVYGGGRGGGGWKWGW